MTTTSEQIHISSLGWACSKFAWASIQKIEVLGLPSGITLSAYQGMFTLPMQPDGSRPYHQVPSSRAYIFFARARGGTGPAFRLAWPTAHLHDRAALSLYMDSSQ